MAAAVPGQLTTNAAEGRAIEAEDQSGSPKSKPPVIEWVDQFSPEKTNKSSITEEDLPPD
jgi:hypothetical protein